MRKLTRKLICALMVLTMVVSMLPMGASAITADKPAEETAPAEKVTLIVQMEEGSSVEQLKGTAVKDSKMAQQNVTNRILANQAQVQEELKEVIGEDMEVGFTYTAVLNGFSVDADSSRIDEIKALPGVKNVYISHSHKPLADEEATENAVRTDVEYGSVSTKVAEMHDRGYRGQGMLVCIVDTEIDVNHEFIGGTVEGARYTKDDIAQVIRSNQMNVRISANRVWKNEKVPFAYNYETNSADTYPAQGTTVHGSHVTGIAAGKGGTAPDGSKFDGVAPEAQIIAMSLPNLMDDELVAAIDDAVKLDADVLNMSWGTDYSEDELFYEVFANAVEAGTYLCNACGNASRNLGEGAFTPDIVDYGSMGSPSKGGFTTNVASADNVKIWANVSTLTVGEQKVTFLEQNRRAVFRTKFADKEYDFVYVGEINEQELDFKDKIVVFDRGDGTHNFAERINIAVAGGAVGAIFLLPEGYTISANGISASSLQSMPTITVNYAFTDILRTNGKLKTDPDQHQELTGGDGLPGISSYSSWGIFSDLELNPHITTPGGNIYSSVPDDTYRYMSGTSMASPHMTGAVALMKQYLKANEESYNELSPSAQNVEVENRMMSSAVVLNTTDKEGNPVPYSPRLQGAGFLDITAAADTPVVLYGASGRTKIDLKDKVENAFILTFTAKNLTDKAVTYDNLKLDLITDDTAESQGMTYVSGMRYVAHTAVLPESVTVPANGEVKLAIPVIIDEEEFEAIKAVFTSGFFADGFVYLSASDGSVPTISIPFMGFCGDWSVAGPIFDEPYYSEDSTSDGTRLGSGGPEGHDFTYDRYEEIDGDACAILGTNPYYEYYYAHFRGRNERRDYSYESEDWAYISPNGDEQFDYLCVATLPLRKADKVVYTLADAQGNTLAEGEGRFERYVNASYVFDSDLLTYDLGLEDGDYSVKVSASYYEDSQPTEIEMPFKVDNIAPDFDSVYSYSEYNEETETESRFIEVTATDDKALAGSALCSYDPETDELTVLEVKPVKGGTEGTMIYDVTKYDEDTYFVVEIGDYARNFSEIWLGSSEAPDMPFIYLEDVDAAPGETVELPVYIYDNIGLAGYLMKFFAEDDYINIVDVIPNTEYFPGNYEKLAMDDGFNILWSGTENSYADGLLLTLVIEVSEDAPESFNFINMQYSVVDTVDENGNYVFLDSIWGSVTVREFIPGDINGDGEVTNADIIMLARYLVHLEQFDELQMKAADYNQDGDINNSDLVAMARYVVSRF